MKMFIAFSHILTPAQIEDAKNQLGVTEFIHLKDVAPELQAAMSQIPANYSLADIKSLAEKIVQCAVNHGCEVFFCTGEPTLTLWANIMASKVLDKEAVYGLSMVGNSFLVEGDMRCVQSTTERKTVEISNPDGTVTKTQIFSHVMWRDMF